LKTNIKYIIRQTQGWLTTGEQQGVETGTENDEIQQDMQERKQRAG